MASQQVSLEEAKDMARRVDGRRKLVDLSLVLLEPQPF